MSGLIYVPKHRDIVVSVSTRIGVQGFYKIEAVKPDGRRRVLADWFPNLITTLGSDLLGNAAPLGTCCVGSGNTAPALANTALQTLVASTTTVNAGFPTVSASSVSPYFGMTTTQYNFAAGVATGNLSEVGVGSAATSLLSRALILDGGGVPTTITVLANEALYVTYQLKQYVPLTDVTGTVTIAGVNYNYTLRAANATSANNWAYANGDRGGLAGANVLSVSNGAIQAITSGISGAPSQASSVANDAYVNGSHAMSGTATWGLSQGNVAGGITAAQVAFGALGSRGSYQIGFATPIPKDSSHVLTLSFSSSWAINTP